MKIVFSLIILSIPLTSHAVECQWWQTKYSATVVNKHPKKGKVREHPRREYCRDRWQCQFIRQAVQERPYSWMVS
jgi:hypothetical protein